MAPSRLQLAQIARRSGRRWKIEEAFLVTKRRLGLSYLSSRAPNAIALQVWATWLLDAVLVDLSDAIAEELEQPLDAMSLEMAYRGRSHFTGACHRGEAHRSRRRPRRPGRPEARQAPP